MIMFMDPLAILLGMPMGIDIGIFMFIGIDVFIGIDMFIGMLALSFKAIPPKERTINIDSNINSVNMKLLMYPYYFPRLI